MLQDRLFDKEVRDLNTKAVLIEPKTDYSRRTISIPQTLMRALKAHRATQAEHRMKLGLGKDAADLVITDALGRQVGPDDFSKAFSAAAKAIKPIRFHALRHSHITHLLRNGVPAHVVSARAGHSSPAITLSSYAHALNGDDERAVDVFDATIGAMLK